MLLTQTTVSPKTKYKRTKVNYVKTSIFTLFLYLIVSYEINTYQVAAVQPHTLLATANNSFSWGSYKSHACKVTFRRKPTGLQLHGVKTQGYTVLTAHCVITDTHLLLVVVTALPARQCAPRAAEPRIKPNAFVNTNGDLANCVKIYSVPGTGFKEKRFTIWMSIAIFQLVDWWAWHYLVDNRSHPLAVGYSTTPGAN